MSNNKTLDAARLLERAALRKIDLFGELMDLLRNNPLVRKVIQENNAGLLKDCEEAEREHSAATDALIASIGGE